MNYPSDVRLDIASQLTAENPGLGMAEAVRLAGPLEAKWKRAYMRRAMPWWSLIGHGLGLWWTHGAWLGVLLFHWLIAVSTRHKQLWESTKVSVRRR
jgi:hypothetical protein